MEDILASIRRILNEDEAPKSAPEPPEAPKPEEHTSDVLMLDSSMMVPETQPETQPETSADVPQPKAQTAPPATLEHQPLPDPEPTASPPASQSPALQQSVSLVTPAAAAAAAASVDALMRTLASERSTAVQRGGPTIEDLVRIEIRPLLKDWLDAHLPPLVERLVRAEIERVVSRMTP
jgi:cell pole-organizing protein PopZ